MSIPASVSQLTSRAAELRDLLIRWCNQNSGSENLAGLAAMRDLLTAGFGSLPGARVEHLTLVGTAVLALRIKVRPEAPVQLFFSGHYDTVYGAEDPFQKCELLSPEKLRGPAVIDMKGGLVVMLAALQAFEQTPHDGRIGYEVLLNPDEEIGSFGAAPLFVEAARRHRLGLVFEPARPNGDLVQSRKGTGNFTITSRGHAAHAASAKRDGRNAIAALAEFLVVANRLPEEISGVLVNVGSIRGGGPATNVVPDFAQALLDVRVTQLAERETVLARFNAAAAPINARDGHRLEISGGFNRPPMEATPVTAAAFAAWQRCARDLGLASFSWVHAGGASDANNLSAAGLPCLDGLGPVGDRLHSPDEWIHLPSLVERAQLAALFLHRLAAGEIKL
ncbi:MAG TPA: hydrolase [Candidatus Didemnitutus sp.]|nr:hydrolase [Candidatus Didemnitutus sp.]